MAYKVTRGTGLFAAPSVDSDFLIELQVGTVLKATGEKKDNAFGKAEFSRKAGDTLVGWVPLADCQEIADDGVPGPEPVQVDGFVKTCLMAEAQFNDQKSTAPWFVAADFVIARAIIETGISNAGPKITGSDGVGPLQVTSEEWDAFLKNAGAFSKDFAAGDRLGPTTQIYGATYRMYTDAKAISDLKPKGEDTAEPFLPSYLDVFHAYLTNSPAAALAILDASNSDGNKKINDVLAGVLQPAEVAGFLAVRGRFAGTADAPKSVADFVAATEAAINDGLAKAFDLIKQNSPEDLPATTQGEAPWLDVAQDEEKQNIAEPNERIRTVYFPATDYRPNPPPKIVSWCGAFASYCIKQSGSALAAKSIPDGSALAANWKGWGAALSAQSGEIPLGAVIVLSPAPGTTSSGHVGFFVKFQNNNEQVVLLGGNQSHQVCEKPFPASRIVAVRWLDLAPENETKSEDGPAQQDQGQKEPQQQTRGDDTASGDSPISDEARDLIVASEVSSEAAYNKTYHRPTWPQGQSGVTIGIGYDVGYATAAGLRQDWGGLIPDSMIGNLQKVVGRTGGVARGLATQMRDAGVDIPYKAAMTVFMKKDVPKWVGIVRRALPNTDLLSKDCLGALVSLAYNRGASFSKAGGRYTEMRNIKQCMADKNFAGIPPQFRSMARLWPNLRGLQIRREAEAKLFERGISQIKRG